MGEIAKEIGKFEDLPIKVQDLIKKLRAENRQLRAERNQARIALDAMIASVSK